LLLERELREDGLRLALLRLEPLRLDAGLRALREDDFALLLLDAALRDDVPLDAALRDDVPLDALLLAALLRPDELRPAPLLAVVRRPALRALPVALAPALLAALVIEEAAFSRFLTSDLFVLRASVRSVRSAAATSLYALRALLPRSVRIVWRA
jgi:hypothetical protein